ncbi:malonyl-ACP O-methyltransferase BioC [Epibacterium sp. SM1979]|uniref:Malonyl-[acyl-carrier protein] O-methyltransferase n=1 Tax=Tritonibacter litoralis TaxID=2662264 RepID=A0A843YIN4_9RHOB|nr:malonyl-ACP O-methyltransferase BioC [Tritonibacter litoralis]MQQ09525.1 malonyl-ACP O-methyltransferase BioC [Tritonibacter litoralis]
MKDHPRSLSNRSQVQQSFGRGLATYHGAAVAQKQIAQELVARLLEARGTHTVPHAFEFGCGTGHVTEALTASLDIERLLLNDLVPDAEAIACPMAEGNGAQVTFASGAIEQLDLPDQLDLICSGSTLQWVEDGPHVLRRLCDHLRPGGWLALSTFGTAHFQELIALGSVSAAPNYSDLDELQDWLPQGLVAMSAEQAPITLQFPDARAVLRHLRGTGVNARSGQHWTRAHLRAFEDQYRDTFGAAGQLPLTYDAVWMIAQKQ